MTYNKNVEPLSATSVLGINFFIILTFQNLIDDIYIYIFSLEKKFSNRF